MERNMVNFNRLIEWLIGAHENGDRPWWIDQYIKSLCCAQNVKEHGEVNSLNG